MNFYSKLKKRNSVFKKKETTYCAKKEWWWRFGGEEDEKYLILWQFIYLCAVFFWGCVLNILRDICMFFSVLMCINWTCLFSERTNKSGRNEWNNFFIWENISFRWLLVFLVSIYGHSSWVSEQLPTKTVLLLPVQWHCEKNCEVLV